VCWDEEQRNGDNFFVLVVLVTFYTVQHSIFCKENGLLFSQVLDGRPGERFQSGIGETVCCSASYATDGVSSMPD